MAFCTEDDLLLLLKYSALKPKADGSPKFTGSEISEFIDRAGDIINSDVSQVLDVTKLQAITDNPRTQEPIRQMAINKAAELILVAIHGAARQVDTITDIQYYQKLYKTILDNILSQSVPLAVTINGVLVDPYNGGAFFANTDTSAPVFGDTKYGESIGPPDYTDGFPSETMDPKYNPTDPGSIYP